MLTKLRKIVAIMCCLLLTFTSVAFADTSKEKGGSKEAVPEKNLNSLLFLGIYIHMKMRHKK